MTLDNMTERELRFWARGCQDTLQAIAKNGLWICPLCGGLMAYAPGAYNICQMCGREFGVDSPAFCNRRPVFLLPDIKF